MSRIRERRLLVVALVCVVVTLYIGFRNPSLPTGSEWTCPRMLEIKQEWDSLAKITTKGKSEYEDLQNSLDDILRKNLSSHNVHQLAASCGVLATNEEERSSFDNAVLRYVVRVLVASGDRDAIVNTLSVRCPNRIYIYERIEFHLVFRGKKLAQVPQFIACNPDFYGVGG